MGRKTLAALLVVGWLACIGSAVPGIAAADVLSAVEPTTLEPFGGFGGPMTPGPEGALWFTNGKKLGNVDAAGTLRELALSTHIGRPRDIVNGPRGDFFALTKGEVDRITTGGKVTRFSLPSKHGEAGSIAVARNGTLWITSWARRHSDGLSFGKAYVIRMLPGGRMTTFALPGRTRRRDQAPGSIVAGPRGDIWFTDPALGRFGRFTPAGKLTEFGNRLRPEALVPDGSGGLWFVGTYGAGTITADGKVRELRVGSFHELGIGVGYDATTGPEGDLWFIGEATRVLRMTPDGHLDQVRGQGSPAANHIASCPGGAIWVSTVPEPIKGSLDAPLLRYQPAFPGIEPEPAVVGTKGGRVHVPLSCGGSPKGCSGEVTMSVRHGREVEAAYEVSAESEGTATLTLPPPDRRLLAKSGFLRASIFATVEGGSEGSTELVLRATHLPASRPGHPRLLPLPADIKNDFPARDPDGTAWLGGDVGRFTRITPTGHISTVVVPGLDAEPLPIGFDARGDLWFSEHHYEEELPLVGRLTPGGKLTQVRLPPGPGLPEEAPIGPAGEIWLTRSDFSVPGEIDRISAGGELRAFPIGAEPRALRVDGHGGIWLSEAGSTIVHISAGGSRRTFPVPHHDGVIEGIALGGHGNVWFTHWGLHDLPCAVGHLAPDGNVAEYPVRGVGVLTWISIGRNGDLHFGTESPFGEGRMAPSGRLISLRRRHRRQEFDGSHIRTVAIASGESR